MGRNIHRHVYLRLRCRDLSGIGNVQQLLRTEVPGDPLNFDAKRDGVKHVRMNWRFRSSDQTLSTSPDLHIYLYVLGCVHDSHSQQKPLTIMGYTHHDRKTTVVGHAWGRSQLFASLGFVFLNITMQREHGFPFQINSNNRFLIWIMRDKHDTSLQSSLR